MSTDPKWLKTARRFIGIKETKGPHHNQALVDLLDLEDGKQDGKGANGLELNDDIPWCARFVSAVLELAGIHSARSAWARSYLKWGDDCPPAVGAIAVLERGPKSGHVAFVVGRDRRGHVMLLGGNQSDMVKISPFDVQRVLGWRWPPGRPQPNPAGFLSLPLLESDGRPSRNEA